MNDAIRIFLESLDNDAALQRRFAIEEEDRSDAVCEDDDVREEEGASPFPSS